MLDLTGMAFRAMPVRLIMGMLPTTSSVVVLTDKDAANALTSQEIPTYFTRFDLKRLASYADNLVDFHVVADLLPRLAQLYFDPKGCRLILPPSKAASAEASLATGPLSAIQQSLLVGMGLQMKSMDDMVKELNVGSSQLLALFSKSMRRFSKVLGEIEMQAEQQRLEADAAKAPALPTVSGETSDAEACMDAGEDADAASDVDGAANHDDDNDDATLSPVAAAPALTE
ncbi:hypothetical protein CAUPRSCDRAFT_12953, partial [Caulochytrium protostelioides]